MSNDNTTPGQLKLHQPRTSPTFRGDIFEDAVDWLELYERGQRCNRWDEDRKWHYVYFTLDDSAKTWFKNHETEVPNWDYFRQKFMANCAHNKGKEEAEAALLSGNQRRNESVVIY